MKPLGIRNLLFDLGNVIIDIDVEGAMQRLKGLLKKDARMHVIEDSLVAYECGKISTDNFISSLLSQCEQRVQDLDVIEAWNSMLVGIPSYRLIMLEMLRPNYNVYVLSNTNALHLDWVHRYIRKFYQVEQFEKQYFDQAYYSHLIGDRKPNASIFKFITEDALLTPELTLYMDDIKENLDVAEGLGFRTFWVEPGKEIAEYLKMEGYY